MPEINKMEALAQEVAADSTYSIEQAREAIEAQRAFGNFYITAESTLEMLGKMHRSARNKPQEGSLALPPYAAETSLFGIGIAYWRQAGDAEAQAQEDFHKLATMMGLNQYDREDILSLVSLYCNLLDRAKRRRECKLEDAKAVAARSSEEEEEDAFPRCPGCGGEVNTAKPDMSCSDCGTSYRYREYLLTSA